MAATSDEAPMTETQYLKIINDLMRLLGYAAGTMEGCFWMTNDEKIENMLEGTACYMEEQHTIILEKLYK